MKKYSTSFLFLLVVITILKLTHANNIDKILEEKQQNQYNHDGDIDTEMKKGISLKNSNMFKVKKSSSKIAQQDIPLILSLGSNKSVVQDWNLVCKELCGAGLGGPGCGPQCNTSLSDLRTINQTSQVKDLLEHNESSICSILCSYGLGIPLCMCPKNMIDKNAEKINNNTIQLDSTKLDYNIICDSFCDSNNITLNGCSQCLKISKIKSNDDDVIHSSKQTEMELLNNFVNNNNNASASTMTTATTTTQITTTTPDWNKLCKELCKTGDGGALCNCDLPPFF